MKYWFTTINLSLDSVRIQKFRTDTACRRVACFCVRWLFVLFALWYFQWLSRHNHIIILCLTVIHAVTLFHFEIIIYVSVSSFRFIWILMLWVYSRYIFLQRGWTSLHVRIRRLQTSERLYTSAFDVYWRQMLTYKDGPRPERVNIGPKIISASFCYWFPSK